MWRSAVDQSRAHFFDPRPKPGPAVPGRLGRRGAGVSGHGAILLLPLARTEPPQPPRWGTGRGAGAGWNAPSVEEHRVCLWC